MTVHVVQLYNTLPFRDIIATGEYGVQLFFILSAVTLFMSHNNRLKKERHPTTNFLIRRFFRIAPLFWIAIITYSTINGTGPKYFAPEGIAPWQIIATFLFLHGFTLTSINAVVPGGWSIAAEMIFYTMLPLLTVTIKNLNHSIVLFISIFFASIAYNIVAPQYILKHTPQNQLYLVHLFIYYSLPSQMPVFALGITTYWLIRSRELQHLLDHPIVRYSILIFTTFYLLVLSRSYISIIPKHLNFSLGLACLVICLSREKSILTANPILKAIGVLSYSCYVTHFLAIEHCKLLAESLGLHSSNFLFPVFWITTLAITIMYSMLTYTFIEKPFIALGNRIISKRESQKNLAPSKPKSPDLDT
jgi:peptidoglycan/LPS O-acetylase OafA/YrhL